MPTAKQIPYVIRRAAEAWRRSLGDRIVTEEEHALLAALATPDAEIERQSILLALADSGSSREAAAELLGMAPRTFYHRLHEHDLHREVEAQALRLGHPVATGAAPAAFPRTKSRPPAAR